MMFATFILSLLATTTFLPSPEGVSPAEGHTAGVSGYAFSGGVGTHAYLVAPGMGKVCGFSEPFTVEGWFRKTGDPGQRYWALAGCRDDANGWTLSLARSGNQIRFRLFVSDVHGGGKLQFERDFPNAGLMGDTKWHHAALVHNPRDGHGGWSLFLDGVWQGTLHNPCKPARSHGFPDLILGGRRSFSNSFEGRLSGWRVHAAVLAPDEVLRCTGIEPESPVETVAEHRAAPPLPSGAFRRWRTALGTAPSALSWAAPFQTPFERLYVFGRSGTNAVSITYSDDDGATWQAWRPLRAAVPAEVGAGTPFRLGGDVVLAFTNATFVSGNLLTERNAGRVTFRPDKTRFDPALFYFGTNRVMRLARGNPVFAAEGVLFPGGKIEWGQPEIFLYDVMEPVERICERDGARWAVCAGGAYRVPVVRKAGAPEPFPAVPLSDGGVAIPEGFGTWETDGFAIVLETDLDKLEQDAFLFSTFDGQCGMRIRKNRCKLAPVLQLDLPAKGVSLQTKPGFFPAKGAHRAAFVADYASRTLFVVVDGKLQPECVRFAPSARYASRRPATVPPAVTRMALYPRALSVAEAAERTAR